jgi:biotin carboxyl carrier protein
MATAAPSRGRKLPPRRGVPYYDVGRGEKMILPKSGGKAMPFVETPRESFSAKRALRRAGIRATSTADAGARRASSRAGDLGSGLVSDFNSGWGALLFYVFLSIVGLALLHNALGGRGPAAIDKILGWLGGSLNRLVSPADPLVPRGVLPAVGSAGTAAAPSVQPQTGSPVSTAATIATSVLGSAARIIGLPFQGTHAKAFNQRGGSDNWQSENAVDLGVPAGTQVISPAAGVVVKVGGGGSGRFAGDTVTVHGADNDFFFAHLSSVNVKPGDRIAPGQPLGKSGVANGVAHLHFAVASGSPLSWIRTLKGGQ